MESTLVLIKPDAITKGLVGKILSMYEAADLKLEAMYMKTVGVEFLAKHYEEHIGKGFYEGLIYFMTSDRVIAIKIGGDDAVEVVRQINGATDPQAAEPGTVRFLFGTDVQKNCVHGSASVEEAKRELALWFD